MTKVANNSNYLGPSWWGEWQQVGRHGMATYILTHKPEVDGELIRNGVRVGNLKSHPSDTPPPTRLYLLILRKELQQLGTKCSNLRGPFYSNQDSI